MITVIVVAFVAGLLGLLCGGLLRESARAAEYERGYEDGRKGRGRSPGG